MKPRQQFLTESYYKKMLVATEGIREFWAGKHLQEDYPGQAKSLRSLYIKNELFFLLLLKYTGGESIENLAEGLADYVEALEGYQRDLGESEGCADISPLNLDDELGEYLKRRPIHICLK